MLQTKIVAIFVIQAFVLYDITLSSGLSSGDATIKTREDLDAQLKKAGDKLVIALFEMHPCQYCNDQADRIHALAHYHNSSKLQLIRIDVDKAKPVAEHYSIDTAALPHCIAFKQGALVERYAGHCYAGMRATFPQLFPSLNYVTIKSGQEIQQHLERSKSGNKPWVLLYFRTTNCAKQSFCMDSIAALDEIIPSYSGRILVVLRAIMHHGDIDELAEQYGVHDIPGFIAFKKGVNYGQVPGYPRHRLEDALYRVLHH